MKINPRVFREYDIRGIAGAELSVEFSELLGKAYAQYVLANRATSFKKFTASVGKDCRLTSDDYADGLVRGLTAGGLDVVRLGVCPSPLAYFSVHHFQLDGTIMVTGSHNQADYNGFKICVGHETLHGDQIQILKNLMEQIQQTHASITTGTARKGTVSSQEIIAPYLDYLLKNARPVKKMKIVLDSGNGTAGTVAPPLFRKLGATVVSLFDDLDGRFPNHHPDPTVAENLKHLIASVQKEKADFGVGFDGDSDRLGVVDENGRIIYGDELMVLFSRNVLEENPGATIISEVKCSHRLYNDILAHQGRPIMWKAGHSLIKSKMKEERALLAGELSGHIFFADRYFGFDDAIYAALRLYELLCKSGQPLSSLLKDLPSSVITPEIRVFCEERLKFALVDETKKRLKGLPGFDSFKITEIDGIRIDFGDGWGLLRASNTQPALVLRFEAETTARLLEMRRLIETALSAAALSLGHEPILMPV